MQCGQFHCDKCIAQKKCEHCSNMLINHMPEEKSLCKCPNKYEEEDENTINMLCCNLLVGAVAVAFSCMARDAFDRG